jgi:hypothetical protein
VVARLRKRWETGEFLRAHASGIAFEPIAIPLRHPAAGDVARAFTEVREWLDQWSSAEERAHLRVETVPVGGRLIGVNELPARVWVDSTDALWALLRCGGDVRRFEDLLDRTRGGDGRVAEWAAAHPVQALVYEQVWDLLTATVNWIADSDPSVRYLRQVDVAGVDTKFIDTHRSILAALLDSSLPAERIDTSHPPSRFAARYGFRTKPALIRLRHLDADAPFTDITVTAEELAAQPPPEHRIFVVENEVTFLAFPPVRQALVVWGRGYAVDQLRPLRWLADRELHYWGDIDTHGFSILNRVRRLYPHARSLLMDRATLLAHEHAWVAEPTPHTAHLDRLNGAETALYHDLVEGVLGHSVRLEQERIGFGMINATLARVLEPDE